MVHTYEVYVDIKEYFESTSNQARIATARYEIDAETKAKADNRVLGQVRSDYPRATEYDVRVTRVLK
ncbi:hypothetical protein IQ268_23460 [Oculatella sp. LEGE 06141]|nr:hypothetical protein [Oculatella sp. LEGE 06141]